MRDTSEPTPGEVPEAAPPPDSKGPDSKGPDSKENALWDRFAEASEEGLRSGDEGAWIGSGEAVEEAETQSPALPCRSPLRGRELALGLILFGGVAAASAVAIGPERYSHFATAFGEGPAGPSLALALTSLVAALACLAPWLLKAAPSWFLSLGLFLALGASSPVVSVAVFQPEDAYAAALAGLVLGGLVGLVYAAQIDWEFLSGGSILAAPCALVGMILLPGLTFMISPDLAGWLGITEIAVGGVLGYGAGFLVGFVLLERYAREVSCALCLTFGGLALGIAVLALDFARAS